MHSLLVILLLSFCSSTFAHPGIGIVKDQKGNIYYTDLRQVWKITPDGERSIVVPGVHSHELYIDAADNLFGEHLWYNGEKENTWGHYVWCLKNSGEVVKVKEPAQGFLSDYSFVRDSSGNMYWVERFTMTKFMKKFPDGSIVKLAEAKLGFIGWLYSTPSGVIYFSEGDQVKMLTPDGNIRLLADHIGSKTTDFTVMGRNYDAYGIWTDNIGNIYVAMIAAKKVIRISPAGIVRTILTTNSLWTICSGVFDHKGNLWVSESSLANETRARMIPKEELENSAANTKQANQQPLILATVISALGIIVLLFLVKFLAKKKSAAAKAQAQ